MSKIRVANQQGSLSGGMSAPTDLYAGDYFDQFHGDDLVENFDQCPTEHQKQWLHSALTTFPIMKRSSSRLGSARSNTEGTIGTEQAQITPGLDQPEWDYDGKKVVQPLIT